MKIEHVPVADIKPFAQNPRLHSDKQIANIANSIQKFGFINPILIDKTKTIIAGHGRYLAAKQLNLSQIPVIMLDNLTDKQVRELIVADNALSAQSAWDTDLLSEVLEGLDDLDYLNLPTLDDSDLELDDGEPEGVSKDLLRCPVCGHVNEAKAFKNYENSDEGI